jgi:RimJ/RimL family protein N-acetyltransferase/predicted GNAT family acetyltransferase
MTPETDIDIITNPLSAQFEAVDDATVVGLLAYDQTGNHFDLRHSFVLAGLSSQHIVNTMIGAALEQIRTLGGTITATCPYVDAFVDQHPQYGDLVCLEPPSATPAAASTSSGNRDRNVSDSHPDTVNVFPDTIRTERLTLRPWNVDDTEEAYGIYADPRVTRWTRPFIRPVTSKDEMRRQLDSWIRQSDHVRPPQGRWAIERNETAAVVGGAHLLEMPTRTGSRLIMSWELSASATGRGFAAEAGHGLVHSAFAIDSSLDAVHALTHPSNDAAVATVTRIGLRAIPGIEHRHGADLVLYGISRTDFAAIEASPSHITG